MPIVREAGGIVTDADGDDGVFASGSVLAANPVIHKGLVGLLGQK